MGCWNGTCGISQLPITHGEKIVLFVIQRNKYAEAGSGGFCYPWDQYEPITVPVFGEYNDYGGIENITKNGDIVFNHLISMNLKAIDKELDRQSLSGTPANTEDLLNDYIERGVYENVGFMMVRKDIYDRLMGTLKDRRIEYETGAQSFIDSHQSALRKTNEELSKLEEELKNATTEEQKIAIEDEINFVQRMSRISIKSHDYKNPFVRVVEHTQSGWYLMRDLVYQMAETGDKALQEAFVDLIMMDFILFPLRKSWQIQAGAGSQDDDVDMHMILASAVLEIGDKIKHRYDEEEDEE